ncbi:MAG TPA: RMD1 family protein [Caulobacteraceae bacterium]|nr:RMD1 family protein [Caulobacteraceae bacterium]
MADVQPPVEAPAAAPERAIRVHALLLGERLSRAAVDVDGAVTTAPLSFKVGDDGFVVLFRYGVAVLFGLDEAAEAEALAGLAARMAGPVEAQEDETAQVLVRPDEEEHITSMGAIQLRTATPDHLLIVADALAKSVALARDERHVAAVFDAIEPFAARLADRGRSPGGRGAILRMIGRALLVQHRVSGRVAVREKPDILWDRRDLERLYGRLEDDYELIERAETLDRKLAFISNAASALIDLKDADRSLRLEVIIILLILAEVALAMIPLLRYWR